MYDINDYNFNTSQCRCPFCGAFYIAWMDDPPCDCDGDYNSILNQMLIDDIEGGDIFEETK